MGSAPNPEPQTMAARLGQERSAEGRAAHHHSSCDWVAGLAAWSLSFPRERPPGRPAAWVQAQAPLVGGIKAPRTSKP